MSKFLINFTIGLHLTAAWGGAAVGSYEVHQRVNPRYFSEYKDDLYTGAARGFIRGVYYPYNTITHLPKVWMNEKPPWF